MTPSQPTPHSDTRQDPCRQEPCSRAQAYADFSDPFDPPFSQRQYAQQHHIPRSTLGYWLRQEAPDGLDPDLVAFLRRPAGEAFLRRIVAASLLVFHHKNACGLRQLSLFLELAQLDRFVASSYGAMQSLAGRLQTDLGVFGDDEGQRMGKLMLPRDIALTPDENFHHNHPCLVAIEPVSNFILVETYSERRDAVTWQEAIEKATDDLPVTVVALTGDQAKGIIACAGNLEAQYTPELFHGQRNLARPLFCTLHRQISSVEKELAQAKELTGHWQKEKEKAETAPPRPGRPAELEWRITLAQAEEQRIAKYLHEEQQHEQQAHDALRGVADDYHPFDEKTGQPVTAEQVHTRLDGRLATLQRVAERSGPTKQTEEALAQGKKWLAALVASMAWFWAMTQKRLQEMALPEEVEKVVSEKLLSGLYWQEAAKRGRTPEERQTKQELAERLLREAWSEGALQRLTEAEKEAVLRRAKEIIGLFSRSSSCVEGRNGRLSLLHHGHTRLSAGRLKALTVVHNYVVKRADGSTAAERFFGVKQRNAFEWLLERMPDLPRPAAKRPKKSPQTLPKAG